MSGHFAVIGAPSAHNNDGSFGRAVVFEKSNGEWVLIDELSIMGSTSGSRFGRRVAIEGGLIAVSAGSDSSDRSKDAVYLFELQAQRGQLIGTWAHLATLSDPEHDDFFGGVTLIHDQRVFVSGTNSGRSVVHVFSRLGNQWQKSDEIGPPDMREGIGFGAALAASGDWLAIGASIDSELAMFAGSVYMFQESNRSWSLVQHIHPMPTLAFRSAGAHLAMDADRLIIGGPYGVQFQSAAWIYRDAGLEEEWQPEAFLEIPLSETSPTSLHAFGSSVAIQGDRAVVGSPFVNGNAPEVPERRGFCASYEYVADAWRLQGILRPADLPQGPLSAPPQFGYSIALQDSEVFCGAPEASIVNEFGDQFPFVGGVWSFDLNFPLFAILDNPPPETPIHQGGAAQISVTATGPEPLTYRWYRANSPVDDIYPFSGVETPTLTINPVFPTNFGVEGYVCRVTSPCGTLSSTQGALVQVPPPPCDGDADGSRAINMADIAAILMHWATAYPDTTSPGDSNHDGVVNFEDITTTIAHWLSACP